MRPPPRSLVCRRHSALGFVTAGPLAVGAFKNNEGQVTVRGLLTGAMLTLAGTGGQLSVLVWVGHKLDLGSIFGAKANTVVLWLGILGTLLLIAYAWRSLRSALIVGVVKPKKHTTTVRPRRRKSPEEIGAPFEGLLEIDDKGQAQARLTQAINQLHQEQDDQYEIAVTGPTSTRTAIL
jgi:hypothetical protein